MHRQCYALISAMLILVLLTSCSFVSSAAPPPLPATDAAGSRALSTPVPPATPVTVAPVATEAPAESPASPEPTVYLPTVVAPTAPPPVLDVDAQAAALLPAFATDLAEAAMWDRYNITVSLNPTDLTISGSQQVLVTNRAAEPFTELYFHLYPNHPDFGGSLTVTDVRVNDQPVATSTEQGEVLLQVALPQPLAPGAQAVVSMSFQAQTQREASGRVYGAFNQEVGVWAMASFYPVLARYFADGWDRRPVSSRGDLAVTETALYDVTLDAPVDWLPVTTGVRVDGDALDPVALPENYRRYRFVSGPQRDFFLSAVNGLDQASAEVDGTRITTYYQPGDAEAGQRSLIQAEQSLRAFNERYGPYPLAELEVVQAALTRFLGVEYPGVVLIEQRLYRNAGRGLETTVAHEVAHQWWYSQVGNDYQGAPWIDEGMASFSQIVYYEFLGNPALAEAELESFRSAYLSARASGRDGVVNRPTGEFQGNYVTLVYAKSALFFQALRERLGDEVFFQFMQQYYATYRYDEVTGEDLLATAEQTCGCELDQFYNDWINSAVPVEVP